MALTETSFPPNPIALAFRQSLRTGKRVTSSDVNIFLTNRLYGGSRFEVGAGGVFTGRSPIRKGGQNNIF